VKDIIVSTEDDHPRFRHMQWKQAFEKQQDTSRHFPQFSMPLGEESIKWTEWLSDDGVWARFTTLSQIANLDDGKKEEVRKQIFAALKGDDVERNDKGEVALHVVTYMAWTSRV